MNTSVRLVHQGDGEPEELWWGDWPGAVPRQGDRLRLQLKKQDALALPRAETKTKGYRVVGVTWLVRVGFGDSVPICTVLLNGDD